MNEKQMTPQEALKVIEGNCRKLFVRCGEPDAWQQRQAFEVIKAYIEQLETDAKRATHQIDQENN